MYELPTYYILPLTGLNFKSFGRFVRNEWNLKSTKINLDKNYIKCEVYDLTLVPREVTKNEEFIRFEEPNSILFNIPNTIEKTTKLFVKGQYSKFPDTIKQWIKKHAGIPSTHDAILALYKDKRLKLKLENELEVYLPDDVELLEAPKDLWFIKEKEGV